MKVTTAIQQRRIPRGVLDELRGFTEFGKATVETVLNQGGSRVPVFTNEFWTSRQRAANSLHEISYRACFKPQLPRFFIERFTQPGDVVYDPFMGRGTTLIEAAFLGRTPWGCDINPLCAALVRPRLAPPTIEAVADRLRNMKFATKIEMPEPLLVFYHPETLREICALRHYLCARRSDGDFDEVDGWIQMVAINRLTGHSPGFFSVYTMPPNQAVSVESQKRINERLGQRPLRRVVPELILRKTRSLQSDYVNGLRAVLENASKVARVLVKDAAGTPELEDGSVALTVTSPPFLNIVDYASDNWLRCWFLGFDSNSVAITACRRVEDWQMKMRGVFSELNRLLKFGGHVAFEVGEVNGGRVNLEDVVFPCGVDAGLEPVAILINDQKFTKTANCWGVANNSKGTNTNRVLIFRKP